MKAGYQTIRTKLLVAVLATLMIFGNVISPLSGVFNAYALDENEVKTEEALQSDATGEDQTVPSKDADASGNQDADNGASTEDTDAADSLPGENSEDGDNNGNTGTLPADTSGEGQNTNTGGTTPNTFNGAVYIDGKNGDDNNDGYTEETPVKTWETAKEKIGNEEGTIYVLGTIDVSGEVSTNNPTTMEWKGDSDGKAVVVHQGQTVKRHKDFKGVIFNVVGDTEFKNILVDGENINSAAPIVNMDGKGNTNLTFGSNATFVNNKNTETVENVSVGLHRDGGAVHVRGSNGSTVLIDGAKFYGNECKHEGGAVYINGEITTTVTSGEFIGNTCNKGSALVNYSSSPKNIIKINNALITDNTSKDGKGGVNICASDITEVQIASENGAAIYGNGTADLSVWDKSDRSKLKINEGKMLGGGNHHWVEADEYGYKADFENKVDQTIADAYKDQAENAANSIFKYNTALVCHGTIQTNGILTFGVTKGSLRVKKVDADTKKHLVGVTFTLEGRSNDGVDVKREATTFDSDNSGHDEQDVKDAKGVASFIDILPGTYTLKETKTLSGYQKSDKEWTVVVDKDGKVDVSDENGPVKLNDNAYYDLVVENKREEPKVEKYINNKVHEDLVYFDKEFEYEILAYVPEDAVKATIEDTLVPDLEFVDKSDDAGATIVMLDGGDEANDHKVNGSVKNAATTEYEEQFKPDIKADHEKGIITAEIYSGHGILLSQGKWVKLSFKAKIKEDSYEKLQAKLENKNSDVSWKAIDDNKTVLQGNPQDPKFDNHDGIDNTAKYTVEFDNDSNVKYEKETNTVTVKPETVDLTVKKSWKNVTWADDTKVTFAVYKHKAGVADVKVAEVELDSNKQSETITLPKLEGVTYSAKEVKVKKAGKDSVTDAKTGNFIIGAINYIADVIKDIFAGDKDGDHETKNELKVQVKINKTDLGGKELKDAEIVVYDEKGKEVESWISEENKTFDLLLDPGTYSFEETVAPDGYDKVDTKIGFTVDADGNVTVDSVTENGVVVTEKDNNGTIVLKDAPIRKISKTDLGGEELDGAEMKLTLPDGTVETWTSEAGKPFEFTAVPGNYVLEEVAAPKGYECVVTVIKFTVDNHGNITMGNVTENGVVVNAISGDGTTVILKDAPEGPAIEKYVNKKADDADLDDNNKTGRDGTVHTDLSAFDEVYTYDIQAYITADAKYVRVNDKLRDVLEFVGTKPVRVVVKDGAADGAAPALTSTEGQKDVTYTLDEDEWKKGTLVLTIGSEEEDATKLYPNGKWLQITFNAKIKDEYKSIEALKAKGVDVWTKITDDNPIDDADTVDEFSGAVAGNHEGIWNDSDYQIKKVKSAAGAGVGNAWDYELKSNTATVQPKSKEVTFSKTDLGGEELEGAKIQVVDENGNVVDEWISTKQDHVLHLADGEYKMIEVVAPAGYQKVTTEIGFVVKGDTVALTNATEELDGDGKIELDVDHLILRDAPEKPAIEKYVNKKTDDLADTERDGTVHTDLAAFNEIYTYDIQAYITADAAYVEVTDELKPVLEFVGEGPTAVVVKEGEGESKAEAPKLTKAGKAVENYSIDEAAWKEGKLVLTMGSDAEDAEKLYPNGMWLQITFDAKIKDEYKTLEAIKDAEGVWTEIKENEPIDDTDVVDAFSGASVDAHEGIVNDAEYKVKSVYVDLNVDNGFAYGVKSNTVTVQPPTTEVSFSKTDLGGSELEGAEMVLTDKDGNVIDEWTSGKEDHVLNLADGEYVLKEKVAPEGYYCVETDMIFEVKDGEATLKTAVVDNAGQIEVLEGNKIVLRDAPEVMGEYTPPGEEEEDSEVKSEYSDETVPEQSEVKGAHNSGVNTGDDTSMIIWIGMLMISMITVVFAAIRRRRNAR